MTNEEKARELAFESPQCQIYIDNKCNQNFPCDRFKVALEMAQWKDEEHAKQKQQWIDKAAEWLRMTMDFFNNGEFNTEKFVNDFKQAMEE